MPSGSSASWLYSAPLGANGVVDPVTDGMAELGLGHAAVQRECRDQMDVVDAGLGRQVEHGFDDALTDVRSTHRGERQGDVVEGDRQLHAGEQQGRQWLGIDRFHEGPADGGFGVGQAGQRFGGIDDPAAPGREGLEPELLAVVEQDRRGRPVDVEDEARPRCGAIQPSGGIGARRGVAAGRPGAAGARRRPLAGSVPGSGGAHGRFRSFSLPSATFLVLPAKFFSVLPAKFFSVRRSNATFTAPRRPALAAWLSASV